MAKDPIKKAKNGTYYFRANLGYDSTTGKQIQKYKSGFATKKEARAEYSRLVLAAEEGLAMEKKQPSFKQFIEEIYLPWYKTQVKESTYKNRLNTIEKHFKYFYRKKVAEIEPIHVQTWQLKLAKEYSPNYVRIIQGMLKQWCISCALTLFPEYRQNNICVLYCVDTRISILMRII